MPKVRLLASTDGALAFPYVCICLSVDRAFVTWKDGKKLMHVMAWGAINAKLLPTAQRATAFKFDYSGGRGAYKTAKNTCGRYRGPPLPFVVAACTARDGSHWVVQKWMRLRPDWGCVCANGF